MNDIRVGLGEVFNRVVAKTGLEDEGVRPAAAGDIVVAAVSFDRIVAGRSVDRIVTGRAVELLVDQVLV